LFVRHSAWLSTAPERPKRPRGRQDFEEPPPLTRLAQRRKDKGDDLWEPPMPPLDMADYLVGYLFEVGPATSSGNGAVPLSYSEIQAWEQLARVRLAPWEARFLRRLSCEYVSACREAEKWDCPAPWAPEEVAAEQMNAAGEGLREALRRMSQL
jgi:hypothetical protein